MKGHASMNRIYRLIWSQVSNTWVAVAENAKGRGKSIAGRKLVAAALALTGGAFLTPIAMAGPTGGQVVSGSGDIAQNGATITISQSSQNLSLNWQSFNIAPTETVNFLQPSASAIAVNRIFGTGGSQILGHLNANGQIYLINPNGILFGAGSQVNVGGLVASTLDMTNSANDTVSFVGSGTGSIVNRGRIAATNGGYVAFIGNTVNNTGTITAPMGAAGLGAGNTVTLTFAGNSLLHMQVDQSVLNSLAANGGLIHADGGYVILTAGAKDSLLASVVNNTGIIEARTVNNRNGTITLLGSMTAGTVNVGGTLDASAPSPSDSPPALPRAGEGAGRAGVIETSAAHVHVASDAKVTTLAGNGLNGTWLIDPVDFTIAASGGDMTGAALTSSLLTTGVTILSSSGAGGTAGNINVNDAVSWSANTLTLTAANDININAAMNASGTASLALQYGQGAVAAGNTGNIITGSAGVVNLPAGTTNFTTLQGSDGVTKNYTVITSPGTAGSTTTTDLQGMNGGLALNYVLGANIDASGTSTWNAGAGFAPVGATAAAPYTGTFDGLGHTISGLTINQTGTSGIGLFGYDNYSVIRNVGMVGGSVTGGAGFYVGGLVGYKNGGTISNSYATGSISVNYVSGSVSGTPGNTVGGLVGYENGGTISNSYATGSVTGGSYVGGLVGNNNGGAISNSYATGSVSSTAGNYYGGLGNYIGGLVGYENGTISNSHATGNVNSDAAASITIWSTFSQINISVSGVPGSYIGGLVGYNNGGAISNSYATGSVSGASYVGGLVGYNDGGAVSNSYAKGSVCGLSYYSYGDNTTGGGTNIGGLVGYENGGTISNSYATGSESVTTGNVTNTMHFIGGLVGYENGGTISNSYATGSASGDGSVGGLVGINYNYGTISNSYATGSVTGSVRIGGLVGTISGGGPISNSYATGSVSGSASVGGLVGRCFIGCGTLTANFWDVNKSGMADGLGIGMNLTTAGVAGTPQAGVSGLTTAQMQTQSSFTPAGTGAGNWDFTAGTGSWVIYAGQSNPLLRSFLTPLTVMASNATKTYDGLAYNGSAGVTYSVTPNMSNLPGTLSYTGGTNAGSYTITPGGLYSDQQGYLISYANGALTVNRAPLTVTANNASKTYGNNVTFAGTAFTAAGLQNSETIGSLTEASTGAAATAAVASGPYAIAPGAAAGGTFNASNYTISYVNGDLTINKAPLTVSGLSGTGRVYNGSAVDALSGTATLNGLQNGETLTVGGSTSGTLGSANAGSEGVTASLSLGNGTGLASNYVLTQPTLANVTIAQAPLTVTGLSGTNRTYNGSAIDALSGTAALSGLVGTESLTIGNSASGTLGSANAGSQGVTASLIVSNGTGLASNYVLTQPTLANVTIAQAPLTVTGLSGTNRTYNGSMIDALSGTAAYTGLVGTETLTTNGTLASANAGNEAVTITLGNGTGLPSNYTLTQPTLANVTIAPAPLTVTGLSGTNRTYNGSTIDALSGTAVFTGLVGTETLTTNGTLASANAGSEAVTISLGNGTGLASNYTLTQPTLANANIAQANLTLSGTQVYNGTTAMAGSALTATGVNGETFGVTGTGAGDLTSKNVQTNTALADLTALALGSSTNGGLSNNYNGLSTAGSSVSVTTKVITVTGLSSTNRTYNGSTVDALSGMAAFAGLVGTETLTANGTLASANAGSEAVTIALGNGTSLASNYTLTQPALANVNIAQAPLTVTGLSGTNRTYNGSTVDALSGTAAFAGLVGTETLTTKGTLASANAGSEAVTITLGNGTGLASNYTLTQPTLANVNIAQAPLTVTGLSGTTRTYNGSTVDSLSGTASLSGLIGGETLTLSNTTNGTLASTNAGSEAVATSVSIANGSGGLASNYALTQPTLANVTINPATLTYTANTANMTSGSALPALGGAVSGFVNNETLSGATSGTERFTTAADSTSNAGSYAIDGSGLTSNNANYRFVQAAGNATALTIAQAPLTTTTTNTATETTASAVSTGLESSFGGQSMGGQSVSGDSSGSHSAMPAVSTTVAQLVDRHTEDANGTNPAGNSSPVGAASIVNTTLAIGTTGTLQIVDGGVNAPASGLNVFLSAQDDDSHRRDQIK